MTNVNVNDMLAELEGRRLTYYQNKIKSRMPILEAPSFFGLNIKVDFVAAEMKYIMTFETKAECDKVREILANIN